MWLRRMEDGHPAYINSGTLLAVPFDPGALQVRGTPVPVLERVTCSPARDGSAQLGALQGGERIRQCLKKWSWRRELNPAGRIATASALSTRPPRKWRRPVRVPADTRLLTLLPCGN